MELVALQHLLQLIELFNKRLFSFFPLHHPSSSSSMVKPDRSSAWLSSFLPSSSPLPSPQSPPAAPAVVPEH